MKVRAAPGIKVPREDKPREYITDTEAVDLPDTAYYLRRVAEGDLIENVKSTKTTTKGA